MIKTGYMDVSFIDKLKIKSEAETKFFAETVASLSGIGDVICLFGDLGAGKTGFCRAFIRSLTNSNSQQCEPCFAAHSTVRSHLSRKV